MIFKQKKQRLGATDIPSRVRGISDSIERGNLTDIRERRRVVLRQSDIKDRLNANILANKIVDITAIADGEVLKYNQAMERLEPQAPLSATDTDDLPEGSINLYFTDERAQDAVGGILTDTVSINFTYDDATPAITADVLPGGVDHDQLLNFVDDEHINWTSTSSNFSTSGNIAGGAGTLSSLNIDQSSVSGAIPVLILGQADLSEEMIEFVTTIGVGNPVEAVGAKTFTLTHFVKCTIPGGLTRYLQLGTIA